MSQDIESHQSRIHQAGRDNINFGQHTPPGNMTKEFAVWATICIIFINVTSIVLIAIVFHFSSCMQQHEKIELIGNLDKKINIIMKHMPNADKNL